MVSVNLLGHDSLETNSSTKFLKVKDLSLDFIVNKEIEDYTEISVKFSVKVNQT